MAIAVVLRLMFAVTAGGFALLCRLLVMRKNSIPEAQRGIMLLLIVVTAASAVTYAVLAWLYDPTTTFTAQGLWSYRYLNWMIALPLLPIALMELLALRDRHTTVGLLLGTLELVLTSFVGEMPANATFAAHMLWGVTAAFGYLIVAYLLLTRLRHAAQDAPAHLAATFRQLLPFFFTGWLMYPVVYLIPDFAVGSTAQVLGQMLLCVADGVNIALFSWLAYRGIARPVAEAVPIVSQETGSHQLSALP